MTNIKDKPGGRPAKKRIEKQQRVVSTKLTELQYYAIRKRAGEAGLRVSEYVRQAVVSAEVIPRLNRQDADTIRKLAGEANNISDDGGTALCRTAQESGRRSCQGLSDRLHQRLYRSYPSALGRNDRQILE